VPDTAGGVIVAIFIAGTEVRHPVCPPTRHICIRSRTRFHASCHLFCLCCTHPSRVALTLDIAAARISIFQRARRLHVMQLLQRQQQRQVAVAAAATATAAASGQHTRRDAGNPPCAPRPPRHPQLGHHAGGVVPH